MLRLPIAASCALLACAASAHADDLYSNASASPAVPALALTSSTGSGVLAPNASQWSEVGDAGLAGANSVAGIALHASTGTRSFAYRVADDVVVPAGSGWTVTSLALYVYAPGFSGGGLLASPGASVRFWSGQPDAAGSMLVAEVTGVQAGVTPTNIYRVFSTTVGPAITAPDTTRRVHEVVLPMNVRLTSGTYWIDIQLTPANADAPLYVVPATLEVGRGQGGWNARQFGVSADGSAQWSPIIDPGKGAFSVPQPLDIAFRLQGALGNVCDSVDFNNDQSSYDPQDIEAFLSVYSEGPCVPVMATCNDIDFNNDSSLFDPQDIASFLSVYSEGPCI